MRFRKLGLDLRGEHYTLDRLDSALVLRWAGHMQGLSLYDETLALPGIAQFLSAAVTVTEIQVTCTTPVAAAQAGELLARCSSLTHLDLEGLYMPN